MLSWDEGKDLSSSSCGLRKNNPHDTQLLYKPPDSCSDEYSSSNDSKIAKATIEVPGHALRAKCLRGRRSGYGDHRRVTGRKHNKGSIYRRVLQVSW